MKKIKNTLSYCYTISKNKALAYAKQLILLPHDTVAARAVLYVGNQHEELQIMYANLRV